MQQFEQFSNGIRLYHTDAAFPVSTDSILLAHFVKQLHNKNVVDLGCGCGILGLLLCGFEKSCRVTGIEIHLQAVQLAQENVILNKLDSRMQILHADLRQYATALPANQFTMAISNPPYFPCGHGAKALGVRNQFRAEESCTLAELCACASWLLQYGHPFYLVYRPDRLADLIWQLRSYNLEPKRMQYVRHQPNHAPSLLLMEARLGGKPGLIHEPDLVLFTQAGTPTQAYQNMYHL